LEAARLQAERISRFLLQAKGKMLTRWYFYLAKVIYLLFSTCGTFSRYLRFKAAPFPFHKHSSLNSPLLN
jgi:hypothetical protein